MTLADTFNRSRFGRFLNRPEGRVFRVAAGTAFLVTGLLTRHTRLGLAALAWSVFPLTAGGFDVCYVSAALGGPFAGKRIRASNANEPDAAGQGVSAVFMGSGGSGRADQREPLDLQPR